MGQDEPLEAIAALGDPLRRRLYRIVAGDDGEVTRDDAAAAAGVARSVAAFHLDRLVEEGLLEATFRRLHGRGGPGAGRPSKLYRRATREMAVSLPERHYDLAADLLASAIVEAARTGAPVDDVLAHVAHTRGREFAAQAADSADAGRADAVDVLAAGGYEPRPAADGYVLANCPFHRLVERHPALVCGMNLSFLQGVLQGMSSTTLEAVADPRQGRCCVRVAVRKER